MEAKASIFEFRNWCLKTIVLFTLVVDHSHNLAPQVSLLSVSQRMLPVYIRFGSHHCQQVQVTFSLTDGGAVIR